MGIFNLFSSHLNRQKLKRHKLTSYDLKKDYDRKEMIQDIADDYIKDINSTVRSLSKKYGKSKSSIHKYLDKDLPRINMPQYLVYKRVARKKKKLGQDKGGRSTKLRYERIRNSKK